MSSSAPPCAASRVSIASRQSMRCRELVLGAAWALASSACLSQSYEVSAAELERVVQLPAEERGARLRVTQQTGFDSDVADAAELSPADDDLTFFLWHDGEDHHQHWHGHSRREAAAEADDDAAEKALAVAVIVVAAAATAAVTVGATEGARFDGWVHAPGRQPLMLVDNLGGRQLTRLDRLTPSDLSGLQRAVLLDPRDDLQRLDRHPLDRVGFVYQLELGAESAPFDASSLAASARGALGYMPTQRFGFLLGGAFSSARDESPTGGDAASTLTLDYRMFLQLEGWPLSAGRWHAGPYAELGYGWALADDALGSHAVEGATLGLGVALQLDWTTRLALTLRAGTAWLPRVGSEFTREPEGYRLATGLTLGVSIY
jgi:hypothetical protein